MGESFNFSARRNAQEESLLVPSLSPSCLNADVMPGAEAAIFKNEEDRHKKKRPNAKDSGVIKDKAGS